MALKRGPDVWANLDSRCIDGIPELKECALGLKNELIEMQKDKMFVQTDCQPGEQYYEHSFINTKERLNILCDELLELLAEGPQIIIFETRGDSELWDRERRRLDGDNYYRNQESAGVTSFALRVVRRNGQQPYAFVHMAKIIMEESNGIPNPTEKLKLLFNDENAIWVHENISSHLMRTENSFFCKLNGPRYISLSDLIRRWWRYKRDMFDFYISPYSSTGLIENFHTIFPGETFVYDPFECYAPCNSCETVRPSQFLFLNTNAWAAGAICRQVTEDFEKWGLQLSCMVTVYPRRCESGREDEIFLEFRRNPDNRPKEWWREKKWPNVTWDKTTSCPYGLGDPDKIRDLQKEEWEEKNRAIPVGRRQLKRRRLDRGVANTDFVAPFQKEDDEALKELQTQAKKVGRSLHTYMNDDVLARLLKVEKGDEKDFAMALIKAITNRGVIKRVLLFYAEYCKWPTNRKTRLVEKLVADGYFAEKPSIGLVALMSGIGLNNPEPRLFLLFKSNDAAYVDYFAGLTCVAKRDILIFLSKYLEVRMEERIIQLQSYPYYRKDLLKTLIRFDDEIVTLMESLCKVTKLPPTRSFFRYRREAFINTLIEHGANARLTVENAIKQAVAYAGPNWHDHCDMVVALAKWKPVAEGVKEKTNAWNNVPQIYCVDPNLAKEPECRTILHQNQSLEAVYIINDDKSLDWARKEGAGKFHYVYILPNKNPRIITDTPSMVAIKAQGSRVFAFFPQLCDPELLKKIVDFLSRSPVASRNLKLAKSFFREYGPLPQLMDVVAACQKEFQGKTNEAVCEFTYGHRFCPIAREEWMEPPLTFLQEKHLAYYMEMIDRLIGKIGADKLAKVGRRA